MLMMPAAADQRVHEQRGGGNGGKESTHARTDGVIARQEAYRIHRTGGNAYCSLPLG
jgi:hypothetical protein